MPRSRSTSSLSCESVSPVNDLEAPVGNEPSFQRTRICLFASLANIVPVCSSNLSLRVLFPWSMCATMQKFLYRSIGIAAMRSSSCAGVGLVCDVKRRSLCVAAQEMRKAWLLPPTGRGAGCRRVQARATLPTRLMKTFLSVSFGFGRTMPFGRLLCVECCRIVVVASSNFFF